MMGESKAHSPAASLNYREYIVYDRRQAYPEYLIEYRRSNTGSSRR